MSTSSDHELVTRRQSVRIACDAARATIRKELLTDDVIAALHRIADGINASNSILLQIARQSDHCSNSSTQLAIPVSQEAGAIMPLKDRLDSWIAQNRAFLKKKHPGAARVSHWRATLVELFPFTQEDMALAGQKQQPKAHKHIQNALERRGGHFVRLGHDQYVLR